MPMTLTETQLDALRELANIASGTAAGALSQMLGREVDISVPRALALSLAEVVEACGDPERPASAIAVPVTGAIDGRVLLLCDPPRAQRLCALLGVEPGSELGDSALCEIGNVLGAGYLSALSAMTGLELLPGLPSLRTDMAGALIGSLAVELAGGEELALLMDSELTVAQEQCAISFVLMPTSGAIAELLAPLGLAVAGP